MLSPKDDRVDYGDKLRPPQGFELSCALATSFTLDLETLMCLPIALCFDNTLEGKLEGEKLALLEAIGQLSGRLKVFFQQGNIKVPLQFNRLFTLLEDCLVPIVPATEFSSFHPKIWLLRFTGPNNEVRYRLLVLSRNLTFDRSWDVAVTLEGELRRSPQTESIGLLQLLRELKPSAANFSGFKDFENELPYIEWKKPLGFNGLKTLVGGKQSVPLDFGGDTASILVISPFLHPKALDWLQKRGTEHYLLSRAEELNRIGKDALKDWDCYALSDRVVSGEDDLEGAREQNLHAKLILVQNGATRHWHLGSANATVAALGDGENKPRNTEFMVRLTGHREELAPQKLLLELKGTKEKPSGIFVEHEFSEIKDTIKPLAEIERRRLEHALINAPWRITATESDDGSYSCEVNSPFRPFVLTSTSIGQEGLDFHWYCGEVVHWNLPENPIDLEQREGRVNRYQSLVVRRRVVQTLAGQLDPKQGWKDLFDSAAKLEKKTDLIPFWHFPEGTAKIKRIVPLLPLSRETYRYPIMLKILSLYRLAFGQPAQHELLEYLQGLNLSPEDISALKQSMMVNLAPINY